MNCMEGMKYIPNRDIVLDPFLGSGQVAVISKMLNRQYIGFEIVDDYFKFAQERLDKNVYRIRNEKERSRELELDLKT